ncbi:hypothetical protein FHW69_001648 [Luteibacter sp. Sphag1AF]|uniref:hypothetical protein n=1 Tax=Luteibacter sp. Sphag1AF TaxID=2587031 RepID=UPI0016123F24|nr:hypothetical protein [Luteibacter sp. Sphag1AF]MBB3227047.1 hypothetical protein [Luteibacter sp. Sphag1AF]
MSTITHWQPIATAPKDNARKLYLASFDESGELVALDFDGKWQHMHVDAYDYGYESYWASACGIKEPTHWAYQDEAVPRIVQNFGLTDEHVACVAACLAAGRYVSDTTSRSDRFKKVLRYALFEAARSFPPTVEQAGQVDETSYRRGWHAGYNEGMTHKGTAEEAFQRGFDAALAQPRPVGVPEGWKLVPIETTTEMEIAGGDAIVEKASNYWKALQVWKAMLAAAPAPGKGGEA